MIKILYAACQEGMGHKVQRELISIVLKEEYGYEVIYADPSNEFNIELSEDGKIIQANLCPVTEDLFDAIDYINPDITLSDFELSTIMASADKKIPCILIDGIREYITEESNPLWKFKLYLEENSKEQLSYGLTTRYPLVDPTIYSYKNLKVNNEILIYNSYSNKPLIDIKSLQAKFPAENFYVVNNIEKNIYYNLLGSCKVILCNGNLGVITDSIALEKSIISWPIPGHSLQKSIGSYCQVNYGICSVNSFEELCKIIDQKLYTPPFKLIPRGGLYKLCNEIDKTIKKLL